jgi:lycopene cyclase domain-containing protein
MYLALILIWFVPPLLIQWLFDPNTLAREIKILIIATLIPSIYFGLVDSFAINQGIWEISEQKTTGLLLGNLPIEEQLFFVTTSLLLAQGMILWHSIRTPRN